MKLIFRFLIFLLFFLAFIFPSVNAEENILLEEHIENIEVLPSNIVVNLPLDVNQQIAYFVKYFTTEKKEVIQRWFKRCGPYLPYFKTIFREEKLPEDLVYLALVESGCNPFAVSRAGAVGIWQFVEVTARQYGLKIDYWIDERKDFIKATYAAARYLKRLYEIFGDWRLAVASYNAGEGRVLRALKSKNYADYWKVMMSGAIPFETFAYLPQWLAITILVKNPQKYGFEPIDETPWEYIEIEVPGGIDLKAIALAANSDLYVIRSLNAELRREFTPPGYFYSLKLPSKSKDFFYKNLSNLPLEEVKVNTPNGEVSLFVLSEVTEEVKSKWPKEKEVPFSKTIKTSSDTKKVQAKLKESSSKTKKSSSKRKKTSSTIKKTKKR